MQRKTAKNGTIAYSDKVQSFRGQLEFLEKEVFSGDGRKWDSANISQTETDSKEIYRAFYLSDEYQDPEVAKFLLKDHIYIPTSTPQFEEKALMSFIWDIRFKEVIRSRLGDSDFELLRSIIPKTWILGEEQYVDGGLPEQKSNSLEIATLGKSKRKYVLKQSGFNVHSSWGEGVVFLHKKGGEAAKELIKKALDDKEHLYIMQEFRQGKNVQMTYVDSNYVMQSMKAKVRITPYFAYSEKEKGNLIAIKVTGCENTEYIHASTASINTSVIKDEKGMEL